MSPATTRAIEVTKEKCKPLTNYTYPNLIWRNDRIPIAQKFDDPYYSLDNGLEEVRHVFLNGNKLSQRLKDGFKIAELGFGTGLNFLSTLWQWRLKKQKGKLSYTSFEAFPMKPEDMVKAQSEFAELSSIKHEFSSLWIGLLEKGELYGSDYHLQLILGDARRTIKNIDIKANCWFLDGFSPAKNPELWEEELLNEVYRCTANKGTLSTYSAAGFVRRNLSLAGFEAKRVEGFGRKRHMTIATKKS